MYVYLANIGTRDIRVNSPAGLNSVGITIDLTKEGWLKNPREDGKRLWDHYIEPSSKAGSYLEAPIQSVGLKHVFKTIERLDKLYLFVSDQPESTDEWYRSKDTCWIGQILRKWLVAQMGTQNIDYVEVVSIAGNPADYNNTVSFFKSKIEELKGSMDSKDVTCVYVAPVGGADASNVALMLHAVRIFRQKAELLYITPERKVYPLGITSLLLSDYVRQQGQVLLERHDYIALHALFDNPAYRDPWAKMLCYYADRRMSFDFAGARLALNEAFDQARGDERTTIGQLVRSLEPVLKSEEDAEFSPQSGDPKEQWEQWLDRERCYLAELYYNLKLKAEKGEWVDFLGRLFRMHEALLRYVFEKETRCSTDKRDGQYAAFEEWIENNNDAKRYLTKKVTNINRPATRVLKYLLSYCLNVKTGGDQDSELMSLRKWVGKVEKLTTLRNKSIIAHGWEGVSEEEINNKIESVRSFLEKTRSVLEGQGVSLESDWVGKLQDILESRLSDGG